MGVSLLLLLSLSLLFIYLLFDTSLTAHLDKSLGYVSSAASSVLGHPPAIFPVWLLMYCAVSLDHVHVPYRGGVLKRVGGISNNV